jgi:tetratricopeptide (TPR) repeat protein
VRALLLVALTGAGGLAFWVLLLSDTTSPAERFAAALAAREQGNRTLLVPAIQELERDPAYADHAQLLSAVQSLSLGRFEAAYRELALIPRDGPLRTEVLLYTGETLYWLNRFPEAENVLRMLASERPDYAPARRWLGAVYYSLGAYHAAIEELEALIELDPDDYHPHRLIGLMYWDFERYTEAIPHYERALELNPPADVEGEIRVELARSLAALHRYEEALETLEEAPESAAARLVAARSHWNSGRPELARELLASAQAENATDREAYLLEADMRSADGEFEQALEVMRDAVAEHPHDAECRYRYALLLEQTGHSDESAAEMAIYQEKKTLATRLTELNFQALHDPRNAELRDEIADLCESLGKPELAQVWREAAEACRNAAAQNFVEPQPPG